MDCLFIGHNDLDFINYEKMVRSMGTKSGAYKDLNLNFIEYAGQPYRIMDILNHFYFADKPEQKKRFYNGDFFSPAIAYLGSYVHRRGFSFGYINSFNHEKEKLKQILETEDVMAIAITTTLYVSVQPVVEIVQFIKQYNENAKIIIGGPFISTQMIQADEEALEFLFEALDADFYVNSLEGEYALVEILQALKNNTGFGQIDNVIYRDGYDYIRNKTSMEANKLEENMVDWSLFPKEEIGEFVSLRTSKSCPFSCSFCGFPERAGKYTFIDTCVIEQELNTLRDLGTVTTLTFIDDTFNVPKERFKEILRMMIRNKYPFRWNSHYRCQFADRETVELMKESGCEGVFLGIESGSDKILRNMNKQVTTEQYRQGLELLHEYGITTHTSFIIGFPGETDETIQETIDFIEQMRPTFFRTQLWYCDPVTPIWKEKDKYQIEGSHFNWKHATMDYVRACEWIDHIFQSLKNSLWLPQNSFEIFSVFYLQQKGMSLERIKEMVAIFDSIIKDKFKPEHMRDANKIARLEEVCRF